MNLAHIGRGRGWVSALKGQGVINSKVTWISSLLCVLLKLQSPFSKSDTFRAGTKCPSKRDVRLIESQLKGVKKGKDHL